MVSGCWTSLAVAGRRRCSLDARRGVGLGRAGLRLRSGAFAPDFPLVIFVRLRLPSDSLGRIDGARTHGARDAVLRGSLVCGASRPVVRAGDLRGRRIAAARAAAIGIRPVGRRGVVRFALAEVCVLMASRTRGGAVMGGARRPPATTRRPVRAPPIGHWGSSDD